MHSMTCTANVRLSFTVYITSENTPTPRLRNREREEKDIAMRHHREAACSEHEHKNTHPAKSARQAALRAGVTDTRGRKSTTPNQSMRLHLSVGETQTRTVKRGKRAGHPGSAFSKTRVSPARRASVRRNCPASGACRAGETHKMVKPDTSGPFRVLNSFTRTWPRNVRFHGRFCRKRRAFHDSGSLFGQKPPDT